MSWIDADDVLDYIESIDYFGNGGENELFAEELEAVARKANGYLVEQLNGNDWFNIMVNTCINDALAWRCDGGMRKYRVLVEYEDGDSWDKEFYHSDEAMEFFKRCASSQSVHFEKAVVKAQKRGDAWETVLEQRIFGTL